MILSIGPEMARYIAASQSMYPEEMREDEASFQTLLASTEFNWGVCENADSPLLGWVICTNEEPASPVQIYWYDLAVLQEHQGKGIGRALMRHAYEQLRWHGKWIRMHTRTTSYPRDPETLAHSGYRMVRDVFIPHHYLEEYGIDEDAHELLLAPI